MFPWEQDIVVVFFFVVVQNLDFFTFCERLTLINFSLLSHFDPYLLALIDFEPIWTVFCGFRFIEESNMSAFRNKLRISPTIGHKGKKLGIIQV